MKISWNTFERKFGPQLDGSLLKLLNKDAYYFESANSAWGVVPTDKARLWLEIAVGRGMDWVRDLALFANAKGFKVVAFETTEGNRPVNRMANYYGATKLQAWEDKGIKKVVYEIDLNHRRFKNGR